jgi:ATP phosphoribosyltransferase
VEFSWGATEGKVIEGLCDAVVEVTETGSTLRANNLRVVEELLQTHTQLIANREAYRDPWKSEKIEQISLLLQGALRAEGMVGLKMNVSANDLKSVIEILPSITAPTVANLFQTDWFSVETIISEKIVRELIPKLQKRGAIGIIEYPLNKVI